MADNLEILMWMDSETKQDKTKDTTCSVGSCLQIGLFLFLILTWV